MGSPPIFELTLQSTTIKRVYRVVAQWRRPGELPVRVEHELQIEEELSVEDQLPIEDWLRLDQPTIEGYGEVLGRMVFKGLVRDRFVQARGEAELLRVLLAVEAKTLRPLRWERLAAPEDGRWRLLGLSQRTPLSLYLPSTSDRRFPPFGRRELRALVLVANPKPNEYGAELFDEAEAIDTVLAGLGEIPSVVLGKDPRAVGPPTLEALCARLTAERFTLLHVIGHGLVSRRKGDNEPRDEPSEDSFALLLDGEGGEPRAIPGRRLIERLGELRSDRGLPHLAFLAVCDSAAPRTDAAFGGLGQRLVGELGMPAVVAMTDRVSQATALTLSQALYARLREHGEVDRALAEACVAIRDHDDATVPALFSRLVGRPMFSDELDRPPSHDELTEAVGRLEGLFERRAPVLLDTVRRLSQRVARDPSTLTGQARRDHEAAQGDLELLCEDALELSFSALARGREPPEYDVRCPFPGLRAFTAEQREFFVGRDALVQSLIEALERCPLLAVLGSSGCGKSSLVMAGLIPRLQDDDPALRVARMRPGGAPGAALDRARAELGGATPSVLYVDQLEEVFTLCSDETERWAFFDRLLAQVGPRQRVIVSMRADFIGECAPHEALRTRLRGLELIPPMTGDELRRAIEQQAQRAGLRYQTGLCELILRDVEHEPGAMPLSQHVLRGLYERRHGRWLRVDAYEELGRVHEAITRTAEAVWADLEADDRDRLRATMLELAEVHRADDGDSMRYLRRRVPLGHLYATLRDRGGRSMGDADAVLRLVDRLAHERLLVKTRDETRGDVVEVAHEALLRSWDRLQKWLEDAQEAIRLRQDMEGAKARWHGGDRAPDFLEHVGKRGVLVRRYLDEGTLRLGPDLSEYFGACEKEDRRRQHERERQQQERLEAAQRLAEEQAQRVRVFRRAVVGVTVVGVIAIVAAVVAYFQYRAAEASANEANMATAEAEQSAEEANVEREKAERSAEKATAERDRARDALLMAYAQKFSDRDPTRWLLGLREIKSPDLPRWRTEVLDVLQRPIASAVLGGHEGPVIAASFSHDGTRILTASWDHTARVWNANGSGTPTVLRGHQHPLTAASFSHDGTHILTASSDKTARVWNTDGSGSPIVFAGNDGTVTAASFNHDSTRILTASIFGTLRVWNADGSGPPIVLREHQHPLSAPSFNHDGTRILTVSLSDSTARVWLADGSGIPTVLRGHRDDVVAASFNHDGTRILTASTDKTARIWNADGSGSPTVLRGHEQSVMAVSFNHDGNLILTASDDNTARVWNADGSGTPTVLRGHQDDVVAATFNYDGTRILTASDDDTARVWNADNSSTPTVLRGHQDDVVAASFSHDGNHILTASFDETARVWHANGPSIPTVLRGHGDFVVVARFSHDDTRILTASTDNTARVWSAHGSGSPTVLRGHEDDVIAVSFSHDDTRILTASRDSTARVWNVDGSDSSTVLRGHEGPLRAASFSHDSTRILTASSDITARIWNTDGSGTSTVLRGHGGPVLAADFSHDGTRILTASRDNTAMVRSANGSDPPTVLLGHEDDVVAASFSHDGTRIVTASSDNTARVWNADGSGTPTVLRGHEGPVVATSFNPDGTRIVTASRDNTAIVWNTDGSGTPTVLRGHEGPVLAADFSHDGTRIVTASEDKTARVWPIADALLRDLLNAATTACIPADERAQYLGETVEQARQRFTACELEHGRPAPTWD